MYPTASSALVCKSKIRGCALTLIKSGNAGEDRDHRQWLIGAFRREPGLYSEEVEVKWGSYKKGERRLGSTPDKGYTLSILVSGRFASIIADDEGNELERLVFGKQGDYKLLGPGGMHTWEALEDSIVLTVRWPE